MHCAPKRPSLAGLGLTVPTAILGFLVWTPLTWAQLKVSPDTVRLDKPESSQQLLVTEPQGGLQRDVTREVRYEVQPPLVVSVDADGLVHPLAEGSTRLVVRRGSQQLEVPITVQGLQKPAPVSFAREITPVLTKGRCNSGGCHGKAEGQNGFKLSLLGFDAAADYEAIVEEG